MDLQAEWVAAQNELFAASKEVHYWDTMSKELRSNFGATQYQARRLQAHRRLKRADKRCFDASTAKRAATRLEGRA